MMSKRRRNRFLSSRGTHLQTASVLSATTAGFWILQLLMVTVIVTASYFIWSWMTNPNSLPFRQIKIISTTHYVNPIQLKQTVKNSISGGFFSLDVNTLKQNLVTLPWIASVSIRKVWPNELVIMLAEQQPIAHWDDNGVFNAQGELFYPAQNSIPASIPQLMGPLDQPQEVLKQFLFLQKTLSSLHLHIQKLAVDERGSWSIVLDNGIEIQIGRRDVRQRFMQFVKLYPRVIGDKAGQVQSVDLRYSNGFAVGWNGDIKKY